MNILYLAFACNPYTGSEAQCGWSWGMGMRRFAKVSIVTRTENKESIQRYLQENNISDLKVYYCDVPKCLNIYYKTHKAYHFYYLMWQQVAFQFVKKLHNIEHFDIIHHITLGDFRYLGPYWKLGARIVFGPVGGAQSTPEVFLSYVQSEYKREKIREMINVAVAKTPFYRKRLNHSSLVLAANKETQKFLQTYMETPDKCELLTENGVQSEKLKGYNEKRSTQVMTLLWAGRMVNRKGLSFLLDVLSKIPKEKQFRVVLVGDGPERNKLEQKAVMLSLKDKVHFAGNVSYENMQRFYRQADVFVFPSLRETTGTVLFEAMSSGLPIISFDQNGAQMLIDHTCGIRVRIDVPLKQIMEEFAQAIIEMIDKPEKRKQLGRNAYDKIVSQYIWERKCEMFFKRYQEILGGEK